MNNCQTSVPRLRRIATYRGLRVLAWHGDFLYASRGYQLFRLNARALQTSNQIQWQPLADFTPPWWRNLTARNKLTYRLFRDGFHALTILADPTLSDQTLNGQTINDQTMNTETLFAAVPGAIVTCTMPELPPVSPRVPCGDSLSVRRNEFCVTHKILRGTRPLHITAVPGGNIYWGEYFDNHDRAEVHIYASVDRGQTWHIAHTFPPRAIRHIHNIVYDRYADCLWILTGDEGKECKILRASFDIKSRDLTSIDVVLEGNQQARAVAAIPTEDALYLSTDTPYEQNHILRLDRKSGRVETIADLSSSSIYGCQTANGIFFSTMVEPSEVNKTQEVHLVGSTDGSTWQPLATWEKDALPMRYFQYGNAILPDGENKTNYLAATTTAVSRDDLVTTIWEVRTDI